MQPSTVFLVIFVDGESCVLKRRHVGDHLLDPGRFHPRYAEHVDVAVLRYANWR